MATSLVPGPLALSSGLGDKGRFLFVSVLTGLTNHRVALNDLELLIFPILGLQHGPPH